MREHTDAYELAEYALLNLAGHAMTEQERTTLEALLQRAFALSETKGRQDQYQEERGQHVS